MEIWDLYDRHRSKTGKVIKRGETPEKDYFYLSVHVCVFNSNHKMLIQQRHSCKKDFPNFWDFSAGGSARTGETSQMAAQRELFEEIGILENFESKRPHFTINFDEGFDDIYFIEKDIEIDQLKLQKDEVQAVRWASLEEILNMIKSGEFAPYYPGLIEFIFQSGSKPGCLSYE